MGSVTNTLLQINVVVNSTSTGRIVEEIGQLIQKKGWKSYVAYGRNLNSSSSHLIKVGDKWDIVFHGLKTRFCDLHGLASVNATRKLIKEIDRINPDIIHLHVIHGYYLNYKLLFKYFLEKNIPVVWSLHDCWHYTGHCAYYSHVNCNKWQTGCYECPQLNKYPKSLFIDRSRKNWIDKKNAISPLKKLYLVPVSNWLASELKMSFLKDKEICCIHNGINTEVFNISSSRIREKFSLENKFIILGVANVWEERKGLSDFLHLSTLLSSEEVIILIGLSKKQIKDLPYNIIGITRTEDVKELASFYSTADVFVNPTWEDNFPTTNLEALACGTPVITYNTGGSIEVINVNTGFVVEQGDIKAMKEKFKYIKKQGKSRYQSTCRQYILDNYRKEDRYEEYFRLYEEILIKNKS